jgi:hypothetical protein
VIDLALVVLGALAGYCLLVLHVMHIRCPRCLGRRVIRPSGPRRKPVKCPVCHAKGIVRMPLAGPVHRMFWSLAGDRFLSKRRDEVAATLSGRKDSAA